MSQESPNETERSQRLLLAWYDRNARDLPWRGARDPYAILVSEVMLQQTQAERVIGKYQEFLSRFPTLAALAAASPAEVIRAWAPLGYNRRAVNLQRLARIVVEEHGGRLPERLEDLRALPGIGSYTAAAVACFAFGQSVPVIDTNIRRVLGRLAGSVPPTPKALEQLAAVYLPAERAPDWNQALMDLGATICRAAAPSCRLCPLQPVCLSADAGKGAMPNGVLLKGALRKGVLVKEARASYQTRVERSAGGKAPFKGSDRYIRGRIIDILRSVAPGESMSQSALARRLPPDCKPEHLTRLLRGLERDGLLWLEVSEELQARLPE